MADRVDQLLCTRHMEGSRDCAQPLVDMCFVDLEKPFHPVPCVILWGGALLRAVQALCDRSRSFIYVSSSKSGLFPVHVRLWQGCSLSPVLLIIFQRFSSEEKMANEIYRKAGAASAVMWSVYWTIVMKKGHGQKSKVSIYRSVYTPTLTYGHELWVD